jgi:hypothetical protein
MVARADAAPLPAALACRRPWGAEAIRADPLGFLAEDRAAQRALADLLEEIADALPAAAGGSAPLVAGARLRRLVAQSQPAEERALYAVVERLAPAGAGARQAVAIARREAALTAGLALELADELDALARAGKARAPEALGFMLRACFEALRRRLDWVEAAILPQARAYLDAERVEALGEALAETVGRLPLRDRAGLGVLNGSRC